MLEGEISEDLRHQCLGRIRLSEVIVVEKDDQGACDLAQARCQNGEKRCRRQVASIATILVEKRLQRIDKSKQKRLLTGMLRIKRYPAQIDAIFLQQLIPLDSEGGLAVTGRRNDRRQTAQPDAPELPQQVATFNGLLPAGRGSKSILSTHRAG